MKEEIGKDHNSKHDFEFAIIDLKTNLYVGWAGIYDIDRINKNAELRFFIGEKNFWGKGLSTECVSLLIDYGFRELNLHRLYGGANIENIGSLKIFKKLGFSEEGISKEGFFKKGKYFDLVKFGLINK
jgi:ribosomal-protein-alanine N-acetyltransferase